MEVDNNVLVERLEGVTRLINEQQNSITKLVNERFAENEKSHSNILAQTCKTNGRVSGLENFKNKVIGALIAMNIIILPVVFIVISKWLEGK